MKPGIAFGEHIKTERVKRHAYHTFDGFSPRIWLVLSVLIVGCLLLLGRLSYLQLIAGAKYRVLSDANRTRTQVIHAPRGIIFDRNKVPLVYNTPGFRQVIPSSDPNKLPKTIVLTQEQAISLLTKGKQLEIDHLRNYSFQDAAAHVLGYVGQISAQEIQEDFYKDYLATDWIGKTGIERQYEQILKGIDGKQLVEVDAVGKTLRTLGETDAIPGQDIMLTIDSTLQLATYDAMKEVSKGAVIASTPQGEILSLVSRPSYDPNLFTLDETYSATSSAYHSVEEIVLDNENQPLLNRVIGGVYPPGSTFKLITAVAALDRNIVNKDFIVEDTGVLRVGEFSFANWFFLEHGGKDGNVNMVKAISRSNDIYFYKVAEMIGVDKLSATAAQFGVGRKVGIDLGGEVKGTLPTQSWKKQIIGEQWYLGDTYHYGIGQGYVLTTPLQVNTWTQALAAGGDVYQPHLLKTAKPHILKEQAVSEKNLSIIKEGMIASCSDGGVAYPLFHFKVKNDKLAVDGKNYLEVKAGTTSATMEDYVEISVACKTGTAQHGGEKTLPHAWITLFAPAYDPEIVVTVLVDSGGQGSSVAGPIAKKVLEAWFTEK